jgi:hypothetical protein
MSGDGSESSHGSYKPLAKTLPVGIDDSEKDTVRRLSV